MVVVVVVAVFFFCVAEPPLTSLIKSSYAAPEDSSPKLAFLDRVHRGACRTAEGLSELSGVGHRHADPETFSAHHAT